MSSSRENRQRAAARARLERQMAARREAARRRRVLQARIAGGVAGVVFIGAATWITVAALSGGDEASPGASGDYPCAYTVAFSQPTPSAADPSASVGPSDSVNVPASPEATPEPSPLPEGIVDVGVPSSEPPQSGFQVLTFDTNLGQIQIEMDYSKTPCTANSLAYLAAKGFYDHNGSEPPSCHRVVPDIFALQCGDPTGTGFGGPNYYVVDENLQEDKTPAYHEGDVAMANSGPDTNGSQFFFVYGVSPLPGNYTLWGRVITGLDIVKQVGEGGYDPLTEMSAGGGTPTVQLIFTKVTAGPITDSPAPTPAESPATSESPGAEPSPATS